MIEHMIPNTKEKRDTKDNNTLRGDASRNTQKAQEAESLGYIYEGTKTGRRRRHTWPGYFEDLETENTIQPEVIHPTKIYGTDFPNDTEKLEEIQSAYNCGYRFFDCAYTYGIPPFNDLKLSENEKKDIRVIYKYKAKDKENNTNIFDVIKDLDTYNSVVTIDTIMLHEIPGENLDTALFKLADLCKKYGAHAGISNVPEEMLDHIRSTLRNQGVELKRIENKCNLLSSDLGVREYALKNSINYIGFGLLGAQQSVGSCDLSKTEYLSEDFDLFNVPTLLQLANKLGISINALLYGWAEHEGISIISRSRNPNRQQENYNDHAINDDVFKRLHEISIDKDKYINQYFDTQFKSLALETLDTVWGKPNGRYAYFKEIICNKDLTLEDRSNYEAILADIHWLIDEQISFADDIKEFTGQLRNISELKAKAESAKEAAENKPATVFKPSQEITYHLMDKQSIPAGDLADTERFDIMNAQDIQIGDKKENSYYIYDHLTQRYYDCTYSQEKDAYLNIKLQPPCVQLT